MRMIPKRSCDPGGQEERCMFESLAGARLDPEAEAKVRAALGG